MSKLTLTQLVNQMQGKSLTYGWDAITLYDQRKTNELLFQLYVERFNSEDGYIEPVTMEGRWGDGSYTEHMFDLKLGAPRLSFEISDPSLPVAKTRLTMDMIGGMIVSTKKFSGNRLFVSRILKVMPVGGPQLWMDQPVTKARVTGLGDVFIDLRDADNFKANFVVGELAMADVGKRFEEFIKSLGTKLSWFPLGRLEGDMNGILTPNNFEVRTMKSDPNALFGDEQYGDGAVILYITLREGQDGDEYLSARDPYLIPADGNGEKFTGAMLLSSKILATKILKPALESSIGTELVLRVLDEGKDIASRMEATAGGKTLGYSTTVYKWWDAAHQREAFADSKVDPFPYDFTWRAGAGTGLRVGYGTGGNLTIDWAGDISGRCKVPSATNHYDFSYQCRYDLAMKLVAKLDPETSHVELSDPDVYRMNLTTTYGGNAAHYWNMEGESATTDSINNRVKSLIYGVVDKIDIPSIDTFLIRNLLFPGHNALHLNEAFVPGDLAVFGEIDPLRTTIVLSPANSTIEASRGRIQFNVSPTPTNLTWTVQDIDRQVSMPELISPTGYFTAPEADQLPDGFLAVVVTAEGTLNGVTAKSSALLTVLSSAIVANPLYDAGDPGESRRFTAESVNGGTLEWKLLTPQWGSTLSPMPGEPNQYNYVAGPGGTDPLTPFYMDKIEIKQVVEGVTTTSYIHFLITKLGVNTSMYISEESDPASGNVRFEMRGKNGPIDPSRVIWKFHGGVGTFDDQTGDYQQPAFVPPGSLAVISGTVEGLDLDSHALAAIPLPLDKYIDLVGNTKKPLEADQDLD